MWKDLLYKLFDEIFSAKKGNSSSIMDRLNCSSDMQISIYSNKAAWGIST
jgi:hypothetical protein